MWIGGGAIDVSNDAQTNENKVREVYFPPRFNTGQILYGKLEGKITSREKHKTRTTPSTGVHLLSII